MPDEISVMVGADGKIESLHEEGILSVYRRCGCQCNGYYWQQTRIKNISLGGEQGIKELRGKMAEVIEFMGDCRVLITRSVGGVPYFELEKAGFSVWEGSGDPVGYLDEVAGQESNSLEEKIDKQDVKIPSPLEVFPGCYRISLREIQRDNTSFTSKQVLLPFFRKSDFRVLEILCDHIPPWLETGLAAGEYIGSIEACGRNMSKITIVSSKVVDCRPCSANLKY